MTIRVRVTKNQFARVAAQLAPKASAVVQATALEVSAQAKENSRVDTGTMRRGWHTYHRGPFASEVRNPVPYTIYNEYGTAHMGAQPMIIPAIENARPTFKARLAAIFKL